MLNHKLTKKVWNIHSKHKKLVLFWVIFLILAHYPTQYLFDTGRILGLETFHELLDLDAEKAFGAWTSQALFLLSGVSLLLSAKFTNYIKLSLGALLVLFSIDESISLHERFLDYFTKNNVAGQGFFSFTWLYVGLPIAIFILIFIAIIIYRNGKDFPSGLLIGIALFLTGAVGFEGIGGIVELSEVNYSVWMVGVEETVELLGILLIFYSTWGLELSGVKKVSDKN